MLKWIASQRGNNPRSTSPTRSNHPSPNTNSPWLTDDPLATINVNLDTKRKSVATSKRRQVAESNQHIYSVTRTNPLFIDTTPAADVMSNLTDGEKRLMDESRSSNRSEQCQTPSSSGYESAADPRLAGNNATTTGSNHKQQHQQQQESVAVQYNHRQHQRHHQQRHLVDELSPASDYRRQFVLGPRTLDRSSPGRKMTTTPDVAAAADGLIPSQQRIGKANLLHQNSFYVTRIHMPSAGGEGTTSTNQKTTTTTDAVIHDEWEKYEQQAKDQGNCFNTQKKKIPHPVWPTTTTGNKQQRTTNSSAIVQQNENYVTKILIAPKMFEMNKQRDEEETMDSIVTHSLLVMTSYDDDQQSIDDEDLKKETKMEITESGPGPAELSEIRQLSQTLSQSRVVTTVSRALSKSSAGSSSSSETAYPTTNAESSSSSSSSSLSTVGGSIARRISMMKERWDKSSRRRLLTESDDDDPCAVMTIGNRRLDHVYVPQNGDVNFSMGPLNPRNNNHSAAGEPFSYLAGIYHPATITEEVTVNESQVCAVILPSSNNRMSNHYDPFEQDRLSNSSSRSSGSRRVTFSADTVDNEHSTKSSTTNSITSSSRSSDKNSLSNSVDIIEELKLNPHYLPHRYQQPQPSVNSSVVDVVGTSSSRLAGYYSYNLQAQLDNYNAKGHGEKVSTWEHYHQQDTAISSKGATTNRPGSSSAGVVRLDPYNNLQLHPNYVAACQQERSICVDFTLDGVEEALLQRRSDSHKLRRRICCCLLLLLCLVVLVIVVIVISLYLSQGQKIFGSLGPF